MSRIFFKNPGSIPNHKLQKNLQLNGQYLSNDGDDEGITVDNDGKVLLTHLDINYPGDLTLKVGFNVEDNGTLNIDCSGEAGNYYDNINLKCGSHLKWYRRIAGEMTNKWSMNYLGGALFQTAHSADFELRTTSSDTDLILNPQRYPIVLVDGDPYVPSADDHIANKKYVDDNIGGAGAVEGVDVNSTTITGTTKFLRVDGAGGAEWIVPPGGEAIEGTAILSTGPETQYKVLMADGSAGASWVDGDDHFLSLSGGTIAFLNIDYGNIIMTNGGYRSISNVDSSSPSSSPVLEITALGNVSWPGIVKLSGNRIGGSLVLDQDDMSSDSEYHISTQQSIKAYVDDEIASVAGGTWNGTIEEDSSDQVQIGWDGSNYLNINVADDGHTTLKSVGTDAPLMLQSSTAKNIIISPGTLGGATVFSNSAGFNIYTGTWGEAAGGGDFKTVVAFNIRGNKIRTVWGSTFGASDEIQIIFPTVSCHCTLVLLVDVTGGYTIHEDSWTYNSNAAVATTVKHIGGAQAVPDPLAGRTTIYTWFYDAANNIAYEATSEGFY